jgi:hypothetical protein
MTSVLKTKKNCNLPGAGPGRPKGLQNKFTVNLKDAFLEAFEGLGGAAGLLAWAKDKRNKPDFYRMITKMLPANVTVDAKVKADLGYEQAREVEKELAKEKLNDPS